MIPYQVCLQHNIKRGFMLLRRELKNDSGRVYYTCIDAGWVSSVPVSRHGSQEVVLLCTLGQYHAKQRKREKTTMCSALVFNSPTITSFLHWKKKSNSTVWSIVSKCVHSLALCNTTSTVPESPWPSISLWPDLMKLCQVDPVQFDTLPFEDCTR